MLQQNLETSLILDDEDIGLPEIITVDNSDSNTVTHYMPPIVPKSSISLHCNYTIVPTTTMDFIIMDSGPTYNMFKRKEYFNCLKPVLDKYGSKIFVEMGNKYLTPIKGYSLATFVIDRHTVSK